MDKLSIRDDPHTEYAMLKSCFALPKFSYIMRTVDPRPYKGTMEKFDKAEHGESGGGIHDGPPVAAGHFASDPGRAGPKVRSTTCPRSICDLPGIFFRNYGGGFGPEQEGG